MIQVEQEDYEHALGLARRQGYEHAKREHQQLLGLLIARLGGTVEVTPFDMMKRHEISRTESVDGRILFAARKDSK